MAHSAVPDAQRQTSAFLRAAYEGNITQLRDLLSDGVSVNCANQAGLQAIHFAAKTGCVDVIDELLKHGADADALSLKGNTPLHVAGLLGQTDVVKLLLRHGANVNLLSECNEDQFTPLYMAAQIGHQEIVMLLLAHGADPTIPTKNSSTPRDVAHQQGYQVVAELLEEYERRTHPGGAKVDDGGQKGKKPLDDSSLEGAVGGESKAASPNGGPGCKLKTGPSPVYQDIIPSPKHSPLKTRCNGEART